MALHVNRSKGHRRGGGAPKGNQNAKGNKGGTGRPPIYDPIRFPTMARSLAADGKLDVDLAQAFMVSTTTIYIWKQKHPEFAAACRVTDEERIAAVQRSLFHRATGYSHPAKKIMTVSVCGGISEIVEIPYVEHFPPDVAAIKYYLNNRAPAEWRGHVETEAASSEVVVRVTGGLPDKEA